jgi:hypothetical protein
LPDADVAQLTRPNPVRKATMPDRPLSGRVFFEQMIHDNLDIGRPDKVSLIFGRRIHTGRRRSTRTRCRTRVISTDVVPSVHIECKTPRKDGPFRQKPPSATPPTSASGNGCLTCRHCGRSASTPTGVYSTSDESATTQPTAPAPSPPSTTRSSRPPEPESPACGSPTLQSLLAGLCIFRLLPNGFTNRDLRTFLAPLRGQHPEDISPGPATYDLRRLLANGMIERAPHSHRYQVTDDGIRQGTVPHPACTSISSSPASLRPPVPAHPWTRNSAPPHAPTRKPSTNSHTTAESPREPTTRTELDSTKTTSSS